MLAIFKKELRSYFNSMMGYIFIAFFLVIIGLYFVVYNLMNGLPNFEYVLATISFIFTILVPILTMKIMAEENRQKTDQLLLTSPLKIESIVLGKYFSIMTIYGIVMCIICFYPLILSKYGTVNLKVAYASIFGFFLFGGAYIAIGLFISALTENQVVAAVVTFIVILITTLMESIAGILPTDNKSAWLIFSVLFIILCCVSYVLMHNAVLSLGLCIIGEIILTIMYLVKPTIFDGSIVLVFKWFSVASRYDDFSQGLFNISSIVYYISIIFIFNFLTVQALKKRRWS